MKVRYPATAGSWVLVGGCSKAGSVVGSAPWQFFKLPSLSCPAGHRVVGARKSRGPGGSLLLPYYRVRLSGLRTLPCGDEAQTLRFVNKMAGTLVIRKLDKVSKAPLAGAEFELTYAEGGFVDDTNGHLSSKGRYTTNDMGEIRISVTGTVVVKEVTPDRKSTRLNSSHR